MNDEYLDELFYVLDSDLVRSEFEVYSEKDESITDISITGSEEFVQYSQLVAAELDSGAQLQALNNSVNALIVIVFLSVVIKILFRIVDEMF